MPAAGATRAGRGGGTALSEHGAAGFLRGCRCSRCTGGYGRWRAWCRWRDSLVPIDPLRSLLERVLTPASCDLCLHELVLRRRCPHLSSRAAALFADRHGGNRSAHERRLQRLLARGWLTIDEADRWCVAAGSHLALVYPRLYDA